MFIYLIPVLLLATPDDINLPVRIKLWYIYSFTKSKTLFSAILIEINLNTFLFFLYALFRAEKNVERRFSRYETSQWLVSSRPISALYHQLIAAIWCKIITFKSSHHDIFYYLAVWNVFRKVSSRVFVFHISVSAVCINGYILADIS